MPGKFFQTLMTPDVLAAQARCFGRSQQVPSPRGPDPLTAEEALFISRRDSFYMATVSSDGWPYVQHRGGRPGFLKVLSASRLGFADYKGNRQMLSTGNVAGGGRVALFLMDYPNRERLKILGHARVEDARQHPGLVRELAEPADQPLVERLFLVDVVSFDWNCPKYITPRFTEEEMGAVMAPLRARIEELEKLLAAR